MTPNFSVIAVRREILSTVMLRVGDCCPYRLGSL